MIPAFAPMMLMALPNSAIQAVMRTPVPGRLLATPERGSFFHVLDRMVGGTTLTATREIARYSAITITRDNIVAQGIAFPAIFVSSAAWPSAAMPSEDTMSSAAP